MQSNSFSLLVKDPEQGRDLSGPRQVARLRAGLEARLGPECCGRMQLGRQGSPVSHPLVATATSLEAPVLSQATCRGRALSVAPSRREGGAGRARQRGGARAARAPRGQGAAKACGAAPWFRTRCPPPPQFQPPCTRQRPGAGGAEGEGLASGRARGLSQRRRRPGTGTRSVPSPGNAGAAGAGRGLAWERR